MTTIPIATRGPMMAGMLTTGPTNRIHITTTKPIAGLEDLDDSGDWEDVPSYGHCWHPRATSADWAPYRDGYWSNNYAVGLTWVSNERWGWAPYHYGRWAHVNQNWYWVPAEAVRQ